MPVLDLAGVPAGYQGRPVLEDVHLRIEPGERIAIVGESGAGKTTLLRLIREHCAAPTAIIPQDLGLVQALSVFHNVYMGQLHKHSSIHNLRTLFWPAAHDVDAVREILEPLRLSGEIFAAVRRLSGGQQQRTAVARALFNDAAILIGDEPVSAVDDHQAREILSLAGVRKETVIVALHDRVLALSFADRIIGLKDGKISLDTLTAGLRPGDLDGLYRT
ncbi:MAG: ATP-binding cassette domain-containing protein [Proteobacteria bacterium]|nr:ATP-binding cassette domain-containing protein [Pseudomonadota bacterium]